MLQKHKKIMILNADAEKTVENIVVLKEVLYKEKLKWFK